MMGKEKVWQSTYVYEFR